MLLPACPGRHRLHMLHEPLVDLGAVKMLIEGGLRVRGEPGVALGVIMQGDEDVRQAARVAGLDGLAAAMALDEPLHVTRVG